MPIVTIRGQLGSGAPEIGRQVADILQIDYVDREIIAEVAAILKRRQQEVVAKEMPPFSLWGRIAEALERHALTVGVGSAYLPPSEMPLGDSRYLEALSAVVRELAQTQRMVIRGRGSQFILKDYPQALHILVIAPLEMRVNRTMSDLNLDENGARHEVAHFDDSRREFTRRYFHAEWEDPAHYDLVINTEHLSVKVSASIIVDALHCKEG